jgi:hypothetical protein
MVDGAVVVAGIEVKAAASANGPDGRRLRKLRDADGSAQRRPARTKGTGNGPERS